MAASLASSFSSSGKCLRRRSSSLYLNSQFSVKILGPQLKINKIRAKTKLTIIEKSVTLGTAAVSPC